MAQVLSAAEPQQQLPPPQQAAAAKGGAAEFSSTQQLLRMLHVQMRMNESLTESVRLMVAQNAQLMQHVSLEPPPSSQAALQQQQQQRPKFERSTESCIDESELPPYVCGAAAVAAPGSDGFLQLFLVLALFFFVFVSTTSGGGAAGRFRGLTAD